MDKPEFQLFHRDNKGVLTGKVYDLFVEQIVFTDRLTSVSPTLDLVLNRRDPYLGGLGTPKLGELFTCYLTSKNSSQSLPTGEMQVGTYSYQVYGGDRVRVGCFATALIGNGINIPRHEVLNNIKYSDFIRKVASDTGLSWSGTVQDFSFVRFNLQGSTYVTLLNQLADEYGAQLLVQNNNLIYTDLTTLENANPIAIIDRSQLNDANARFEISAKGTYGECFATYTVYDNLREEDRVAANNQGRVVGMPRLEVRSSFSVTKEQALTFARNQLRIRNSNFIRATLQLSGDPRWVAGVNIQLEDFAEFSGKYQIDRAVHTVDRSRGWVVDVYAHRVIRSGGINLDFSDA